MGTRYEIEAVWAASTGPILAVLDEDGVNMANAQVRLTGLGWVYVDDLDGYQPIDSESVARWDRDGQLRLCDCNG